MKLAAVLTVISLATLGSYGLPQQQQTTPSESPFSSPSLSMDDVRARAENGMNLLNILAAGNGICEKAMESTKDQADKLKDRQNCNQHLRDCVDRISPDKSEFTVKKVVSCLELRKDIPWSIAVRNKFLAGLEG